MVGFPYFRLAVFLCDQLLHPALLGEAIEEYIAEHFVKESFRANFSHEGTAPFRLQLSSTFEGAAQSFATWLCTFLCFALIVQPKGFCSHEFNLCMS